MACEKELKAGVIGLGMIGGGIAVSLARSGRVPAVYDIYPEAAEKLKGVPKPLSSPAEVAEVSDVVMVCVVNADQARQVITGPRGLLEGSHTNLVVCLVSTIALPVVKELADECAKHGASLIDCGVTPGDKAAENGMVAIVGGEADIVHRAIPILEDWSKKVVHCGPVGAGMATKIARNVITFGGWRVVKEAQRLAQAAGVNPMKLVDVIETSDPEGATLLSKLKQLDSNGILSKVSAEKTAPFVVKDLEAAAELAQTLGVSMPSTDVVRGYALDTLDLSEQSPPIESEDARERGAKMADTVYGYGIGTRLAQREPGNLFNDETIEQLFANIWTRPGLSIRDRRLLVIGVTAAIGGRPDLIKIQALGGLANKEFTAEQLDEMVLHLTYYVGWCNASAVAAGISDAITAQDEMNK